MDEDNKRAGNDRRSRTTRRIGIDMRPDDEKRQIGERRSKADRRAGGDRRSDLADSAKTD
jgi:hypothetical protein